MYQSCLLINVGDNPDRPRPGRLWLRNLYRVHQRLCMAFPSSARKENDPDFVKKFDPDDFSHVHGRRTVEQAFLFRIDPWSGGNTVIAVQSALKPDWDYAFHNAQYLLAAPPQIRLYDPQFQNGQLLTFCLAANATHKKDKENRPEGKNNYGRRVPVPWDEIEAWLTGRAMRCGFEVEGFGNVRTGYLAAFKGKNDEGETDVEDDSGKERRLKRFFLARFEGRLRVTASDSFLKAVIQGIGPAKAFGFGLLTVAPIRG
jgi:CRISPR system Cascade subunit CasE